MFAGLFPPQSCGILFTAELTPLPTTRRNHPLHGQMRLRNQFVALSSAILFAACSTDVVTSAKTPGKPNFAVNSAASSGDYIVLTNGQRFPAGFADKVAASGGRLIYVNDNAGFAAVTGLTSDAAAAIGALSGVSSIQSDAVVSLDTPLPAASIDAAGLTDPTIESQGNPAGAILAAWQWNMRLIKANTAWAAGKLGDPGVTVAIIDTGIDYDNRDFFNASTGVRLVDLSRSASFIPSDDAISATMFPARNTISDFNGHGTNVASQVSSLAFAFSGVTSRTTLLGVKALNAHGSGTLGSVLSGVLWAADHNADIANMSLGGSFAKSGNGRILAAINRVFNYAKSKGMLIVVAAGNALPPDFIPVDIQHNGNVYNNYCDAPHVICVAAVGPLSFTGNGDVPAWYSNYGRSVIDVAAPGGNTTSTVTTWPWGQDSGSWVWAFCSRQRLAFNAAGNPVLAGCQGGGTVTGYVGTSQASPHVAGLAALLVAKYGHGQPTAIKHMIEESGDPINPLYGRSRINVQTALGL